MTIMYRIRKKTDHDLYVKGTPTYNDYDKVGRLFPTIGKLRAFISSCLNGSEWRARKITDWEIVEVELIEKSVKDIHEIIKPEKLIELLKK